MIMSIAVHSWQPRNQLSSFQATMNNNARYDRSTNFLELEVNVPRTIGILRDALRVYAPCIILFHLGTQFLYLTVEKLSKFK